MSDLNVKWYTLEFTTTDEFMIDGAIQDRPYNAIFDFGSGNGVVYVNPHNSTDQYTCVRG